MIRKFVINIVSACFHFNILSHTHPSPPHTPHPLTPSPPHTPHSLTVGGAPLPPSQAAHHLRPQHTPLHLLPAAHESLREDQDLPGGRRDTPSGRLCCHGDKGGPHCRADQREPVEHPQVRPPTHHHVRHRSTLPLDSLLYILYSTFIKNPICTAGCPFQLL